jgi:hypothetical protein
MHKALDNVFFIFGDARSGNTFLSYQMMAHMEVVIPPESNFIAHIFDAYRSNKIDSDEDQKLFVDLLFKDTKFNDWKLSRQSIEERLSKRPLSRNDALREILSLYCEAQKDNANAVGIQKNYIQLYPELRNVFPSSKIIQIIRDGRAVFNSKKNNRVSDQSRYFQTDPATAAMTWIYKNKKISAYQERHDNVLTVRYETLVMSVSKTLQEIAEFLQLNFFEDQISNMSVPDRYKDIHQNVGTEAKPARLDAWKNNLDEKDVRVYESIAGPYLLSNSYALENHHASEEKIVNVLRLSHYKITQDLRFKLKRFLSYLRRAK